MSGILRNTLRLVGTAKYPTNNSTYLQSMTLTTNRLNHTSPAAEPSVSKVIDLKKFQAEETSTNFWTTIQGAGKKILSIFSNGEKRTSNFGFFEASLSVSNLTLKTSEKKKKLIFPPTFNTTHNGVPVEPKSNKKSASGIRSFELGKWIVSLDGEKLRLKVKDSDELFTLEHGVYVEAHQIIPQLSKNGSLRTYIPQLDPSIEMFSAKLRSKTNEAELYREFPPSWHAIPFKKILHYGHDVPDLSAEEMNDVITDKPNSFGQMKLKFPMAVSLEGARQTIRIKNSDDKFTLGHIVDIQAEKVPAETPTKFSSSVQRNKLLNRGILHLELASGDVAIKPSQCSKQTIIMRQEVDIVINLDSKIPSILVCPYVKNVICVDQST